MAIPISDVTRRVVYSGSAGVGPYSFSFEVLAETDLAVYKDQTLLTLTTDYSVTINVDGTGSVTLVSAATASNNITLVGDRAIARTTDFVTGGDLFANSLNDELDSLTIFAQQVKETADRGLKAPITDPTDVNMVLPIKASRIGKTLAFDANGNPTVGEDIGNWRGNWAAGTSYTVRDLVKDPVNSNIYRVNTSHTSSGSAPISTNADSAKWDLVIDASSADEAEEWATKTNGIVESTDYSSKAYAIGGTGVTSTSGKGAAKEWATTTGATVDTAEYSAKEYAVGTTAPDGSAKSWSTSATAVAGGLYGAKAYATGNPTDGSAKDWAQKTGGLVAATDYSAREYAIGPTVPAGSAKEWATTTGSKVDASEWSAKEYAQGTLAGTGGSSKSWATTTGGLVDSTDYSSKEYAIGTTVPAGSAKDWATITGGLVDASEYSAKEYATGDLTATGGSAKAWAEDASSPDGTTTKSAKTWAAEAASSASDAQTAQTAAEAALDEFTDTYLGALASAPTLDNDGDALTTGDLYFNSTDNNLYVYTSGGAWKDVIDDVVYQTTNTTTLNPSNGTIQEFTWNTGSSATIGLGGFAVGDSVLMLIDISAVPTFTLSWSSITWINNNAVAPTLNTTGITAVVIMRVNAGYYGFVAGDGT